MNLNTRYNGIIEYKEEDIYSFPKGIPGFEHLKKFIIFSVEDNEVFSVLNSIEDENTGIIVMSPFTVEKNYEVKLEDEQIKRLKIENEEDVLVLNTVTLNSDINKITTNLRAPIIINIKEKLGEQIILNKEEYKVKHPIFKEEA